MAKGGFTGAVPPRETSPEEYSGVWDITEQYGEQKAGSWPFQADDCAPKSLRFGGNNAKLSRTPAAAGSASVFTLSCWVKRTLATNYDELLSIDPQFGIRFTNTDKLHVDLYAPDGSSWAVICDSQAVFRDPSAWYSIVLVLDTNAGTTNADRLKLWVNGEPSAFDFTTYWGGLITGNIAKLHTVVEHTIGMRGSSLSGDFLIADYHFIDGQALEPTDFGFYDGQGIWQPKRFTGDYSSGPIYSNAVPTADGFRSGRLPHHGFDGDLTSYIALNNTTFNLDVGSWGLSGVLEVYTGSNHQYAVDGGSASSMTANGWTNVGNANSITTLTFTRTDGNYPYFNAIRLDGVILTDASVGRNSFHLDFSDGVKDQSGLGNDWTANGLELTTGASTVAAAYTVTGTTGTADLTSLPNSTNATFANIFDGTTQGYYTGSSNSFSATVTLAQAIPYTSTTIRIYHATLNNIDVITTGGTVNASTGGSSTGAFDYNILPSGHSITGFTFNVNSNQTNDQVSYIEVDGQKINLFAQPNDLLVDSPVNGNEASTSAGGERRGNYCTLNPLDSPGCTLTNGNLNISCGSSKNGRGTVWPSSGKWYFEFDITTYGNPYVGIGSHGESQHYVSKNSIAVNNTGHVYVSTNGTQTYPGYSIRLNATGSYMCAFDLDNGKIWWGKDGIWYETTNAANNSIALSTVEAGNGAVDFSGHPNFGKEWTVQFGTSSNTSAYAFNAGQRAFKYPSSVPAGFSPLATSFLPEPTIKRGDEAMDVALWTGNNSTQQISGFRISPDLVWIKNRDSGSYGHRIVDSVRGATYRLQPHANAAQGQETTGLTAFNNDGFTLGAAQDYNLSANNHVGWMWDAGDATTTIAAGGSNSYYNQDQTWSGQVSGSVYSSNYAKTNAFSGTVVNNATLPANNNTLTFTPSPSFTNAKTVKIYYYYPTAHADAWKINGTSVGNNLQTTGGRLTYTFDVSGTGFTSLAWSRQQHGSEDTGVYGIEVDGKLLVDNGVSVTNVPEVECKVRANQAAGFSIVKVDSPTNTETRVHGLSKAPEFFICKSTASADSWHTYWAELGKDYYINIYPIGGKASSDQFGSQEPNHVSFYVKANTGSGANKSGGMIYYLWHSVEGFSKFSSYTGTGGDVFVYCGFRPRVITIKNADQSNNWLTYDTARDPSNAASHSIQWDYSYNDTGIANDDIDILSNGFMIKATRNDLTGNGHKILFGAWAEHPFASNARAR